MTTADAKVGSTEPGAPGACAAPPERRRLRSVDAFRGAVLALMLFTPATGSPTRFPLLHHATWDGLTVSDVVFPTFLVTSGLSLAFLLRDPVHPSTTRRLARRFPLLVVLGLIYNAYGDTGVDLARLRFTGVLQTIGIAGALATIAVLVSRRPDGRDRTTLLGAVAVAMPATYGVLLWHLGDRCVPSGACSPFFELDIAVFGGAHVYGAGASGWDPEGLAVSITATSLVLIGYLAGRLIRVHRQRLRSAASALITSSAVLVAAGWILDDTQPINKRLFTLSFVSVAAGAALCAFAVFVIVLDLRSHRNRALDAVTWPLVALGRNALVVFLGERALLQTATMVHVGDHTLQNWLLEAVLPVGKPAAHLAYTGLLLLVVVAVTGRLHRQRRYLAL